MKNCFGIIGFLVSACKDKTSDVTDTSEMEDSSIEESVEFFLGSDSFESGGEIPLQHACTSYGGDNISPQLHWENTPEAGYLAIIMDDEVSPCGSGVNACRHWGLFNIPIETNVIPEGVDASAMEGVVEGLSYRGTAGYDGPCPPNAHIYKISIYALSDAMPLIEVGAAFNRSQFEAAYTEEIIEQTTIQGTFDPEQ